MQALKAKDEETIQALEAVTRALEEKVGKPGGNSLALRTTHAGAGFLHPTLVTKSSLVRTPEAPVICASVVL